ncbi:hypothetical protein [Streptomyces sp. PTD9-10]|uniref:hypothetical protein n=1 Tax=unclassified Streptomyces TaxID=2593676 RepID=UPI00300990DB
MAARRTTCSAVLRAGPRGGAAAAGTGGLSLDTRSADRAADGSFVAHVAGLLDPDHCRPTIAFG